MVFHLVAARFIAPLVLLWGKVGMRMRTPGRDESRRFKDDTHLNLKP